MQKMVVDQITLGKILLEKKLIEEKTLESLKEHAKTQRQSLENILFAREIIADEKLGAVMAEIHQVPFVKLSEKTIPDDLLRIVPYALASHQFMIAFEKDTETIKIATCDPDNYELKSLIEKKTGMKVEMSYSTRKDIKTSLKAYNRDVNEKFEKLLKGALQDSQNIESLKDAAKILDTIILFAFQNSASDIHIEPHKEFIVVRYRIDGILQTIAELPAKILDLIITRIKVLSNLRTDEHRAAQDGRFKIDLENNEITLRVSIVPTYDGEKCVMRILSSQNQELNIDVLGYSDRNLRVIKDSIKKTHGIILVTGPTGSGKTTTLYSILKLLNSTEVNIATIEDPIEYRMEGINQIQVNRKTDLTFATGLRALLRQDPDIIMVGEIRDEETAGIAINAALTGHLVLATLHSNDVATTLPRMLDMGVEGFLLGATAKMIVAQRLVRKICPDCKKSYEVNAEQLKEIGEKYGISEKLNEIIAKIPNKEGEKITLYKGAGCAKCSGSGFKGRISISEAMEVTEPIQKLITKGGTPSEIAAQSEEDGMETMFFDGIQKVLSGVTTIEEILRVMRS